MQKSITIHLNLPKIKFDINHIAIANKNGDYMNTICDTEVGEPKKIILPVIIPMKNINELDTELRIKSQISTLEKEKINIQQELNKIIISFEDNNLINESIELEKIFIKLANSIIGRNN